jgi:hypothetical protein
LNTCRKDGQRNAPSHVEEFSERSRHSAARRSSPLGGVAQAAGSTSGRWPTRFPLPNGFRPEGITIGPSPYAYLGSIANGDVYRASLATGRGHVISQGLGAEHPVIGLKIDRRERLLFLSGGGSREIRVAVNTVAGGDGLMRVDPRTGVARSVDIGGTRLPNGDGLLLLGRTRGGSGPTLSTRS